jgi:hypothetical protein
MDDKKENQPRKGWAEAFQKMRLASDDKPLIPDVFEDESFLNDPENDWEESKKLAKSKKHP